MEMTDKFSDLERKIESLEAEISAFAEKISEQDRLIRKQAELIARQEETFEFQSKVIAEYETRVALQAELIEGLTKTEELQRKMIDNLEALVKYYEEQFSLSQRRRFGPSSEQSPDQLRFENLFNEPEDQADPALPEPTIEEVTYKRKKRAGKRSGDLSGLTVERTDYELPESERICPECGGEMDDIGVTVRNELEIVPAKVINREHAVHAYGCPNCAKNGESNTVIRAEAPAPLIKGSLASPSAVAHIASQKYVNGIPLYRNEKGLSYDGVALSRQTMANWMICCSQNYLSAVYSLLKAHLLTETVLHADETTVQVLKEPDRSPKSDSYEWVYRTGCCSEHQIVIFEYRETRRREHPDRFLKDFKGYLHTDGYEVYHGLPPDITVVGCYSHARRYWEKFYESIKPAEKRDGSDAERGLVYINLLFAFEHEYAGLEPEERLRLRLEKSKPVSDDFFEWVETLRAPPKSLLGEAVNYTLSQRKYLENIYLDGRTEISNNRAERSIRPFVQGRKQWLFSNTPDGAESSSIYYSLIETAKENGLNPYQYIKLLLEKLPGSNTSDLESLLPWGDGIPDYCRIPVKESNIKPERPMYFVKKGPLHNALEKLRRKYAEKGSIS